MQTALAGPQSAIVLVDDRAAAVAFSNAYAPEHLELHLVDAEEAAAVFTSAGAVFVGDQTPVSLGDYLAGSNHVLPTGGQARYRIRARRVHVPPPAAGHLATTARPSRRAREGVVALAEAEVLPAHGEAVEARFVPAPVTGA